MYYTPFLRDLKVSSGKLNKNNASGRWSKLLETPKSTFSAAQKHAGPIEDKAGICSWAVKNPVPKGEDPKKPCKKTRMGSEPFPQRLPNVSIAK